MAIASKGETTAETVKLSHKVSEILLKHRLWILTSLAACTILFAVIATVSVVIGKSNEKAFEIIELRVSAWEEARISTDKAAITAAEDALIAELTPIAEKQMKRFAGIRAAMSLGEVYFAKKDWATAQKWYVQAGQADVQAYTSGIAFFNAAVCADELNNADEAALYFKTASDTSSFSMKPRALFNLGRVEEQRMNTEAAAEAYKKLAADYPEDQWTKLAKSRLVAMEVK